ncbi:unnamed protein product [Adineta ricciae]|uniref:Uncharacterized protein n=1 Tax=Adineta ricciae TaxID=249248 RepID=A0A815VJ57_ADIRI|nr:unnamed protein product [Adineta ricciae]
MYADSNDPRVVTSYSNIGVVYQYQEDYPKALEYHIRALETRLKPLPDSHQEQAASYTNIGDVYISIDLR